MSERDLIEQTILRMEHEDKKHRDEGTTREKRWRSVPRETGKFLYQIIMTHRPNLIVEIGMSQGYSTIWMGLAAKSYGGKVVSYEIEQWRYEQAKKNFEACGLSNTITPNLVDSNFKNYPNGIDMVFIDAEKSDYLQHLKNLENFLTKSAIILADNTISHKEDLLLYIEYVRASHNFVSIGLQIGKGLEFSRKIDDAEHHELLRKLH